MQRAVGQGAVMLGASAAGAAVGAAVWTAISGGGYRVALAVAFMVAAALVGLSGTGMNSRSGTRDLWAFLGTGPDVAEEGVGEGLTSFGVFLVVSLPLFVLGLVLFGRR
jgi:hypothetical protein